MKKNKDNLMNSIFKKLEENKSKKINLKKDEFKNFISFLINNKN